MKIDGKLNLISVSIPMNTVSLQFYFEDKNKIVEFLKSKDIENFGIHFKMEDRSMVCSPGYLKNACIDLWMGTTKYRGEDPK